MEILNIYPNLRLQKAQSENEFFDLIGIYTSAFEDYYMTEELRFSIMAELMEYVVINKVLFVKYQDLVEAIQLDLYKFFYYENWDAAADFYQRLFDSNLNNYLD